MHTCTGRYGRRMMSVRLSGVTLTYANYIG